MRVAVCLAAVLLRATATPNGYYHQQYNYKTSSSSYKNNELQHKTDDQGYYSKDGDLEGRVKPKVSSNSEHSEYINPQLRERLNSGYTDADTDFNSHGNMVANSYGASIGGGVSSDYQAGSQYGSDYSEGMASSDHIGGATNVYGAYGSGSQSSYGSSSLRTVASRLQNDLQQDIQEALRSQSSYSRQINISELEAELHRNLTARLNEILREQYGTQTIRGGQSYSLSEGRLQTRPNYEQHDLENLQRLVENSLLQQLRTGQFRNNQIYNQNHAHYESTTTYRPTTYRSIYPNLNVITTPRTLPEFTGRSKDSYYGQNAYNANRVSSNVRYTPVPNPLSITTIASNVQSQLDSQLNKLLEQVQTQYFSENLEYGVHNLDSVLERLRQELKSNLTYILDEELRSQYGTQVQKNNYMFSVGSGGETSGQYNYNAADLENLRTQMETNLLTKLNRDFESARQRSISRQLQRNDYSHSQSSDYRYGSSNNQRLEYSTPRYGDDDYYRPTSASIVPLISNGVKGNQFHGISRSHQLNYDSSGSSSNIVELQRQIQSDLSRQLQLAINQNQRHLNRYSTQEGYGRGSFEEVYQRLYDDLQRNLTQQLQEFEAGSSGYSHSYGSVSGAQLASLKSQLQRNLASQLQSGLQQSLSASSSYSASSGSSASAGAGAYSSSGGSYRAARGSQKGFSDYDQYRSGGGSLTEGEDCQGDDPNADPSYRAKRSYGYRSRPLGLPTHSGSGHGGSGYGGYNTGYNGNVEGYGSSDNGGSGTWYVQQSHHSIGQQEDNSDITQQVEPVDEFTGQQEIDVGQQIDNTDNTQQVEEDNGFGTIKLGSPNKLQVSGQQYLQLGRANYIPRVGKSRVEKLQNVSQSGQFNQKPSSQYPDIGGYGKLELGSQTHVDQQIDNSDLTQQEEHVIFGYSEQDPTYSRKPNIGTLGNIQAHVNIGKVIDSDLTQQTKDINFENPYPKPYMKLFGSDPNIEITQVGSSRLPNFNNFASPIQSTTKRYLIRETEPQYTGQETDDPNITQQVSSFSDSGVMRAGSLVQTSTKKPQRTAEPSFDYSRLNIQTNLQLKPVSEKLDHSNNFQRGLSDDTSLTQQLQDNSFSNLDSSIHNNNNNNNNQEIIQPEPNSNLNNIIPATNSLSTLDLPSEVKDVFKQTETTLIKQLESTIKNDISYSTAPSQLYQNLLRKWQNNINIECQKLLNDHAYHKIDHDNVNQLEKYLKTSFEKKIQRKLQNYGFSRENLGIRSFGPVLQLDLNNQNANIGMSHGYQYSRRLLPKPASSNDFIEREINSQSSITANNERQFDQVIDNSRLYYGSQVSENNRQLYDEQMSTPYPSSAQHTYSNRQLWSNGANYSGYVPENMSLNPLPSKIQQNLDSDSKVYLNTPKPFHSPTTNRENFTPKSQVEWEIGEPGYVPFINANKPVVTNANVKLDQKILLQTPLQQTNTPRIEMGPSIYQSALPVDNQIVDHEINVPSKSNGGNIFLSTTPKTSQVEPLDLSNFPPLSPPESSASVIPAIQHQREIPHQPNTYKGQRINAEREANLLIQKLRKVQQKPMQHLNYHQQAGIDSYESHHNSRGYHYRTENSPNQYNVIQVKLENITSEQLKIINQIDEDFTKIIEGEVQNQIKTTLSYQQSLNKLETELKANLTECIEGNVHPYLGVTGVDLQKYSHIINQKFEQEKIPDLNKYLEIKLVKKIREKLRKAYRIDNDESAYEFHQHGIEIEPNEIIRVELENITTGQLKIINQMEDDFNKQIEAAIQSHLISVSSEYLSSYDNFQKSFNQLEAQMKNNITECVQELTEPGLSKYSDLFAENFDKSKIAKLEKYLDIKLIKNLGESLKTHFKFYVAGSTSLDSNLGTGSLDYNHNYQSSHNYEVQYGQTHTFHSKKASEIEPLEYQHATAVSPASPSYSGGMQGKRVSQTHVESHVIPTSYSQQNSQHIVENLEEPIDLTPNSDIIGEPITEKAGWWQRFGNKVKQGAANFKKKIVGSL